MQVSVAYATASKQLWIKLDLPEGSTALQAITESKIIRQIPDFDLNKAKIGIYGKFCKLDTVLRDGDRVELYRPITADPKTVKRRDTEDEDA